MTFTKNLKFKKKKSFFLLYLSFTSYYCSIDLKRQSKQSRLSTDSSSLVTLCRCFNLFRVEMLAFWSTFQHTMCWVNVSKVVGLTLSSSKAMRNPDNPLITTSVFSCGLKTCGVKTCGFFLSNIIFMELCRVRFELIFQTKCIGLYFCWNVCKIWFSFVCAALKLFR